MPKLKTRKGVRKRFRLSKTGKLMHAKVGRRHILTKKSRKRKRNLRRTTGVGRGIGLCIKKLLPYG